MKSSSQAEPGAHRRKKQIIMERLLLSLQRILFVACVLALWCSPVARAMPPRLSFPSDLLSNDEWRQLELHLTSLGIAWQHADCYASGPTSTDSRLLGHGFHRNLKLGLPSKEDLLHHCASTFPGSKAASLVVLLQVPSAVYLDPFELQNLRHHSAAFPAVQIHGQQDLELPETVSHDTMGVIQVPLDDNYNGTITVPLHGKYVSPADFPFPSWTHLQSGYKTTALPSAHSILQCQQPPGGEGDKGMPTEPAWHTCRLHLSGESKVFWSQPAGNMLHLSMVRSVTLAFEIACAGAILFVGYRCQI